MASADVRQELDCSICLNIYTDPVTLRCGHSYCRVCIDRVLDTQEGSGGYSCPECRTKFKKRPALHRNKMLCNVLERFLSNHSDQEVTGILCTYCVDSPVPAAKSCLHCEVSLCDNHLGVHPKSPEHVLCDPTTSPGSKKCSAHKQILEYYCTEDSVCICVSCRLKGEHKGHHVEMLDEASEKKKLRNVLDNLTTQRQETEESVQRLQERRGEDLEKAAGVRDTVTVLFRDIRRQLEDLEKRVLSEISRHEQRVSLSVSNLIQQLETKKDELSRRMRDIEELCNMSDPVTVLPEPGDWCDSEAGERHEEQVQAGGDLDVGLISGTLHRGLCEIVTGINTGIYVQGPADILLDVTTANNYIQISNDKKTATSSHIKEKRPVTAERFHDYQVMSSGGFSSGRHYWEVEIGGSEWWRVGMCYPSIDRTGDKSVIGNNNMSWVLERWNNKISGKHDSKMTQLPITTPLDRVRIYLDYEAGQLSFYSLCDPIRHLHTFSSTIRHLHTFSSTFTEPLHAVLYVYKRCITISGGSGVGRNLPRD